MRRWRWPLLVLLSCAGFPRVGSAALTLEQILAAVQKANKDLKSISADIEYIRAIPLVDSKDVRYGTLKFKKPRLVRIHFRKPEDQLQIVGERDVWIYTRADKQAEHYRISPQAVKRVGFLDFGFGQSVGDTKKSYKIELLSTTEKGKKRSYTLKLTPKRDDDPDIPYSRIIIELEEGRWVPVRISLFESEDEIETTVKLKNIKVNPFFVFDRDFKFKPPRGAKLIEM